MKKVWDEYPDIIRDEAARIIVKVVDKDLADVFHVYIQACGFPDTIFSQQSQ